ncbi:MAG: tyrosine-type recombinase/integrase, partial [Planctomycetota bacterium]|nr:tyrosine-type recombinase/integrase [Planctomycetota bacterium]
MRHDAAEALREAMPADAQPTDRIFPSVPKMATFKRDLERAGIAHVDASGRVVDFHSLRYTCGTILARADVAPRVAMELMRHTDMRLTMNLYADPRVLDTARVIERMPDLDGQPAAEKSTARKTGTDDLPVEVSTLMPGRESIDEKYVRQCPEQSFSVRFGESECSKTPVKSGVLNGGEHHDSQPSHNPLDLFYSRSRIAIGIGGCLRACGKDIVHPPITIDNSSLLFGPTCRPRTQTKGRFLMSTSLLSLLSSIVLLSLLLAMGCASQPNVLREGSQVRVTDVPPASGEGNGYLQGLETLLKHEGTPVPYNRLMGLSGIAFILQADTGHIRDGQVDTGWWPLDPWGLGLRKEFLAHAVGREVEEHGYFFRADAWGETKDLPGLYRKEIQQPHETQINAGKLALAPFCPKDGTWGFVIAGYDTLADASPPIFGFCARDTKGNFGRCPNWPQGILILGERISALPTTYADIQALRYAVALAHDNAGPADAKYKGRRFTGQKAFAAWAGILRDVDKPTSDRGSANVKSSLIRDRQACRAWRQNATGGRASAPFRSSAGGPSIPLHWLRGSLLSVQP